MSKDQFMKANGLPSLQGILNEVARRVSPPPEERIKVAQIADRIRLRVSETASKAGLEADVRLDGSVAKDTWLSGEADVDIFMKVAPSLSREDLGTRCLKVARDAVTNYVERYAEHPYIETSVEGMKVNIVPCFNVEKGKWKSATDRTPFHTEYMKERLNDDLRKEVRLTKKFAKGVGIYGAEMKVRGFSGMLCETLTLYYRSFQELLRNAATWRSGQLVDVEGFYKGLEKEIPDLFPESLVVVDPVDKGRNVAAAVAEEKMWLFVAASRSFLQEPKLGFFYPPRTRPLPAKQLVSRLAKRGSDLLFVQFGHVDAVVDVLWSQLYKTENSLRNLLKANGFQILRSASWSDEEKVNVIVLEVDRSRLSPIRSHFGPPVSRENESESFLEKHTGASDTVSGPRVEGDRWVVEKKRKHTDAALLIKESLRQGGKTVGVASKILPALRNGFRVFVNGEIAGMSRRSRGLSLFLTEYLTGRPKWLE